MFLEENKTTYKLDEFAIAVRMDIDQRDKHEESLRLRKGLRAIRYWEGRQLGFIAANGEWKDLQVEKGDPWYPNNQIRFFCRSILKEMVRSRSQLSVQPRDDRMESAGAARLVRGIIDRYRQEQFGPLASQTEAMFSMLEGNYFRYVYFDATIDTYKHTITDYQEQEVKTGNDAYYCSECGEGGYLPETTEQPIADDSGIAMTPCPNCGAPTEVIPATTQTVHRPTGEREVPTGDIVSEIVDPMEMKAHLRARDIPHTPFLERNRMIYRKLGKQMFSHWDGQASATSDKLSTKIQSQLEGSPGNYKSHKAMGSYSRSEDTNSDLVLFTQIWLDPMYYYDIELEEDFNGITGKELQRGTKLKEIFTNGMYIAFLGDKLVDYRNENKAKHWTHGSYIAAAHRFWGDGAVDDSLDQQWELNNLDSLMIEQIMFNVGGQTWYNQLKIEGATLGARPRERNPMKNPSPQDNPGHFIYERPSMAISPELPSKSEQIKRDMQSQFGSFSVSSGMPDINVATATGMAILRDQALGFLGPPLELRGEVDVQWAYQVLELLQENMVGKRYLTFGKYDDIEGQWFEASDVRTDFIITQIPGSWFPVSDFDMRQRMIELSTFGGLPMGIWNPTWPTTVRDYVIEKYGVPVNLSSTQADERKQRIELETMKTALKKLEQAGGALVDQNNQPDPLAVQFVESSAPVEMFVDNDDVQFAWIADYLKTDDGMNEHPVIRAALLLHQRAHVDNKYRAQMMLAIMEGIAKGNLIPMPDGSVMPVGAMGGVVPAQSGSGDNKSVQQKPAKTGNSQQGANLGSPDVVGSGGIKKAGDNLPLAQVGSTMPGSQPATGV